MFLSIQENLITFWNNVKEWMPTITTFLIAIFTAWMQAIIKKSITRENFADIAKETIDKTYAEIGDVALSLNVEPILESKVKEFTNTMTEELQKEIESYKSVVEQNNKLIAMLLEVHKNNITLDTETREEIEKVLESYNTTTEETEVLNEPIKVQVAIKTDTTTSTETTTENIDR